MEGLAIADRWRWQSSVGSVCLSWAMINRSPAVPLHSPVMSFGDFYHFKASSILAPLVSTWASWPPWPPPSGPCSLPHSVQCVPQSHRHNTALTLRRSSRTLRISSSLRSKEVTSDELSARTGPPCHPSLGSQWPPSASCVSGLLDTAVSQACTHVSFLALEAQLPGVASMRWPTTSRSKGKECGEPI